MTCLNNYPFLKTRNCVLKKGSVNRLPWVWWCSPPLPSAFCAFFPLLLGFRSNLLSARPQCALCLPLVLLHSSPSFVLRVLLISGLFNRHPLGACGGICLVHRCFGVRTPKKKGQQDAENKKNKNLEKNAKHHETPKTMWLCLKTVNTVVKTSHCM